MNIVMFYHSLLSDWNNGNAHFLRGIVTELRLQGHSVKVYEPMDAWSLENLIRDHGTSPIADFIQAYPGHTSMRYKLESLDLDQALAGADLVIVHEWNVHSLVARVGLHRSVHNNYILLFHDTHHRSATAPTDMAAYDLSHYDGVLAFGNSVAQIYRKNNWAKKVFVWHEAADIRVFSPRKPSGPTGDLVWVGNWGDDERAAEINDFLLAPAKQLHLIVLIHGVRYPDMAIRSLKAAGIQYGDYIPNFKVPQLFARHSLTVHIPRRPYAAALPGIPTIRVFEALACGIPLICAPWDDCENLFTPGKDYLVAHDTAEMASLMRQVLSNQALSRSLTQHGLNTIRSRHTCTHRATELMSICAQLGLNTRPAKEALNA